VLETAALMQLGLMREKLGQKGRSWTEERNSKLVQSLDLNRDGQLSEEACFCPVSISLPRVVLIPALPSLGICAWV